MVTDKVNTKYPIPATEDFDWLIVVLGANKCLRNFQLNLLSKVRNLSLQCEFPDLIQILNSTSLAFKEYKVFLSEW